jgi:hypothetical protein
MPAIQRVSASDNFDDPSIRKSRRKKRLKHLVTRSEHRELLLSKLMRPFEIVVALLSPAFFLAERVAARGVRAQQRDGQTSQRG